MKVVHLTGEVVSIDVTMNNKKLFYIECVFYQWLGKGQSDLQKKSNLWPSSNNINSSDALPLGYVYRILHRENKCDPLRKARQYCHLNLFNGIPCKSLLNNYKVTDSFVFAYSQLLPAWLSFVGLAFGPKIRVRETNPPYLCPGFISDRFECQLKAFLPYQISSNFVDKNHTTLDT